MAMPSGPQNPSMGPMPSTYMAWSIAATILCCLPMGVMAIVKSSQVATAYEAGDYATSVQRSREALGWIKWSAGISIAITVLAILAFVAFIVFVGMNQQQAMQQLQQ